MAFWRLLSELLKNRPQNAVMLEEAVRTEKPHRRSSLRRAGSLGASFRRHRTAQADVLISDTG